MNENSENSGLEQLNWADNDLLRKVLDDPRVTSELGALGEAVPAYEPRDAVARSRRGPRFIAGIIAASVCAVGGGGVAWAVVDPLYRGYIGSEKLIDTTTWGPEWRDRIETYEWPTGFDADAFVDPQVALGKQRPDGIPANNLDAEVLALNACAWFTAYERRDKAGREDAVTRLTAQLNRVDAAGDAERGEPYFEAIAQVLRNVPNQRDVAIRSYQYRCEGIYADASAAVR